MKSLNSYPQFLELARNRYSCRKFDSRPVYRGLILAVIEAAQLAMGNGNDEVKAAADFVTDPIDQDGLLHGVEYLINISKNHTIGGNKK